MLTHSEIPEVEYDKIDLEEIIIKFEKVIAFIKQKKKEAKL
jgi:hypothetical protein